MAENTNTERSKFEAWMARQDQADPEPERTYELDEAGMNQLTEDCMWVAWQARASLSLPAAGQEPVAYALFADGGDIRLWSKKPLAHPHAVPLYTAPQPAVAAGWVMVPMEATEAMKAAAVKYANGDAVYKNVRAEVLQIEEGIYGEVYEAMLSALPPAPSTEGEKA